jgi:hypothetical protein
MDIVTKALDVILSCNNVEQLETAGRYIELIEYDVTENDFRSVIEVYSSQYSKVLRQSNVCAFD